MAGLAELAWELRGYQPKVDDKGQLLQLLDVNNLPALCRRLKEVRDEAAALKKEDDKLKRTVLAHPEAVIGYSCDAMHISETETPDVDDLALRILLKKKGYWERVTETKISVPTLRALAEEDPEIFEAIEWLSSRKLNKKR